MNILVIPEDFRKDQYLLRPLFDRLLISIGKKNARVRVCQDPLLGGIRESLNMERLQEIVERYRSMIQIFILCVDRDCVTQRRQQLDRIESQFGSDRIFLAENAWEELETWTLAGLDLPGDWRWSDIRADGSVKERYFDALATMRAVADGPGGGRKVLGEEGARRVDVIRRKCAEDFGSLATRLEKVIRGAG
ncbi:MAG: hypothetical protein HQL40_01965 [Alphaproteobacteria bacterium]|nr:hypothetical protein [Alphaproteobacteria bacterium]